MYNFSQLEYPCYTDLHGIPHVFASRDMGSLATYVGVQIFVTKACPRTQECCQRDPRKVRCQVAPKPF